MTQTVLPGARSGEVRAPASKSHAHRLLICAALGSGETVIRCNGISRDIAATVDCLRAMGADIRSTSPDTFTVCPIGDISQGECVLPCGESGSTLRFLLPVVGALGLRAVFHMEGRLSQRPMRALTEVLCANGMQIECKDDKLYTSGKLTACDVTLPGNVSSQYISGLLMAMPLLDGQSLLRISGRAESQGYIRMTLDAMRCGGIVPLEQDGGYLLNGVKRYTFAPQMTVEGDWSGAAFFLCAGALSPKGVTVHGLNPNSLQGDGAVLHYLRRFGAEVCEQGESVTVRGGQLRAQVIDASEIPDLIPVLSVVAAAAAGESRIINAYRLRLKESDRLQTTAALLTALGARVTELDDGLIIEGAGTLCGGSVDSASDHRIAMSAAVAASVCRAPVSVSDAGCVSKSYVDFWQHWNCLEIGE